VRTIAVDWRQVEVELRLHWWNRNAMGTLFGGSLFSMTDPFYPLMLQHALGPEYVVWTKSAQIEFVKPGRTLARANFHLSDDDVAKVLAGTQSNESFLADFSTEILSQQNETLARVRTSVYVRKRKAR